MTGNSVAQSEFNDFLFAPIGEDWNEIPLSVLSALARIDVDPWEEAARLAQLPKELATQSLASIITKLPGGKWPPSDCKVIAARLVERLPTYNNTKCPSASANIDTRAIILSQVLMWFIFVVVWGTLFVVRNHVPVTAESHGVQISASQLPLRGSH